MTNYEMTEKLSEKMGVTMEEAKEALEACDWDMLDAALMLEKAHGGEKQTYSTRQEAQDEAATDARREGRGVLKQIGRVLRKAIACGNRNRFEVRRGNELVMDLPVTVLAVALIFAFWVCLPLLVIGLFTGWRYSFSGAELGSERINGAMRKAAEVAGGR